VDWSPAWLFVSRRSVAGASSNTTQEDRKNPKRVIQQIETGDTSKALAGLEQLTQQFRAKGDLAQEAEAQRALGDAMLARETFSPHWQRTRYQQSAFEVLMTR